MKKKSPVFFRNCYLLLGSFLFLLMSLASTAQTTLVHETFGTAAASSPFTGGTSTTPASPKLAYTATLSTSGTISTALNSSDAYLNFTSTSGATGSVRPNLMGSFADVSSNFNSTLSSNTGSLVWSFNMRANRLMSSNATTTYADQSYFIAAVLCATSGNLISSPTASGYAVIMQRKSGSSTQNAVRLVRFTNGLLSIANGTVVTNLTTAGSVILESPAISPTPPTATTPAAMSVKVVYTPTGSGAGTWELFTREDGGTTFVDPLSGSLTSCGVSTDATYTSSSTPMTAFGFLACLANSSTAANAMQFDNLKIVLNNPTINTPSPSSLSTFNYTYGSGPSSPVKSFDVTAANLSANLVVTPPANFEIATTADFSTPVSAPSTVTITPSSGSVASTTIYVRLKAGLGVGNYSGNVALSSTNAATVNVPLSLGSVSAKPLTITGLSVLSKAQDGTTTATLSGSPSLSGVLAGDISNVTLGGTPVANFSDANVGTVKAVTVTGYTISGSAAGNYSLSQPTGLTADITSAVTPLLSPGALSAFGNIVVNQTASNTLTLTGTNLDGSTVTISAPSGYTVSPTTISGYGTSINQTITVTFNPTAVQTYSGNITFSGGNAGTQTVAVSGTGTTVSPATAFTLINNSNNIQRLTWSAPASTYDGVLVFVKVGSGSYNIAGAAIAGTAYTGANANITSASLWGGYSLVYAGTGTSVEVTGLTDGQTYNYQIFAYSGDAFSSSATTTGLTAVQPVTGLTASAANAQSVVAWTNPSFNGTQSNYWDEVLVIASTGSITTPTGNGSAYTASAVYGTNSDGNGGFVVYKGSGSTVTVTGLTNLTTYNYSVFVRHGSVWSAATTTSALANAYANGDYVSVATGNYSSTSTWNSWNGSALVAVATAPTALTNVWVTGGKTVTLTAAGLSKDLRVVNGTLISNTLVNSPLAVSVSGSTIEVGTGGVVGGTGTDDNANGISFTILGAGTTTITGTGGSVDISRLTLSTSNSTCVIDRDITVHYHSGSNTGSACGILPNNTSGALNVTNPTLTINAGKTVTMDKWSCVGPSSSPNTTTLAYSFTINVNGTLTFLRGRPTGNTNAYGLPSVSNNGYIALSSSVDNNVVLNVGATGTINAIELFPNGPSSNGALSSINIAAGGVINIDSIADFKKPTQTVTGAGTFKINSTTGAVLKVGATAGISASAASGPIQTTTRTYNAATTTFSYEGIAAQSTGDGLASSVYGLTINNSTGLTLTNDVTTTGKFTLTSGTLTSTSANLLTIGSAATITGGSSASFVSGPMQHTVTGTTASAKLFPIGKSTAYSPVTLTATQASATSTTYKAEAFLGGSTPSHTLPAELSVVSANRYYSLSSSANNLSAASITLGYDANDLGSSILTTTTSANMRIARGSGTWVDLGGVGTAPTTGSITSTNNFTSLGDFAIANAIVLGTPPNLTAAVGATVSANYNITFTDDLAWRNAITSVVYGSTTLTPSTDYTIASGVITIKPNGAAGAALRTAGSITITVNATNYDDGVVTQTVGAGTATKLVIKTQPTAPASNGAALATQPAVFIQDAYNNTTTSTAAVTIAVGAGGWTIGGTTTINAVNGTATFSGITAGSATAVTGATASITSGSLTGLTTSSFNIPSPVTYYWVGGTGGGAWNTAVWSLTKGGSAVTAFTPAATDVFVFDGSNIGAGATGTITTTGGASTTTVGRIVLQNNANVIFNQTSARTFNISGMIGTDLDIPFGSTLTTSGSNTTLIALAAGATASISGTLNIGQAGTGTHQLTALSTGAIVVNSTGQVVANVTSSVSIFGTATDGSVIFTNGSKLTSTKAGDPFGGVGKNVVVFQSGSTYELQNNNPLNFSGHTFSNFIYNSSSSSVVTTPGSAGIIFDNITISQRSFTISETGTATVIKGNVTVATGATLIFAPASAATVTFAGTAAQTITNSGTLTIPALQTIAINNSFGVSLGSAITSSGAVVLTTGKVNLGAFNLTVASITGGSSTAYVNASGTGRLAISAITSAATRVFPVGTATSYTPLTVSSLSVTSTVSVGVASTITNAVVDATKVLNLQWAVLASPTATATLSYQFNTANKASGFSFSTACDLGVYTSAYAVSIFTTPASSIPTGSNPFTLTKSGLSIPASGTNLYVIGNLNAIAVPTTTTWTGFASTDWNNYLNWTAHSPVSGVDASIPSTSRKPVVAGTQTVKALTVSSGVTLTNSGTINVTGNLSNNGSISGTTILSGTSLQTVSGIGTVSNLTVNNTAGATVTSGSNKVNITGVLTLQLGTLTTNGNVVLKSSSIANSALVAPVGVGGNSGIISGTVQVERFIPKGYRAWRDMAPSVFNAGSIFNNWQEGGSYANTGYGVFITGTTAVTASNGVDATTGLDQTVNSVKSAYTFTGGTWNAVTNTKTTNLNPFLGYRLLVRGDRSYNMYTTPVSTVGTTGVLLMVNATALRATGNLVTGNVVFATSGITNTVAGATYNNASFGLNSTTATGFSSVANPYVAPLDWKNIWDNGRATNLTAAYYYLDPTIGSTGAYVSYNAFSDASSNGVAATRYIQAGQAFFVENTSTSPSLTITEADKAMSATKTSVFGNASRSRLAINLMKADGAEIKQMDGATVVFDKAFSNGISKEDARKMTNPGENLAISRDGQALSIEGRQPATADERLPLAMSQLTSSDYQLSIDASAYKTDNLDVYLVDAFTKSETLLTNAINNISFNVDASNQATYANRFSVVFKAASKAATTTTPIVTSGMSVYPNPMVGNNLTVRLGSEVVAGKYEVSITNSLGQTVSKSIMLHSGVNSAKTITTASKLAGGVYQVTITSSTTNQAIATTKLAVE